MKNYNEKINNFVQWCDQNNYLLYTPKLFELYQMENEGIKNLTSEEMYYMKVLYETRVQKLWADGILPGDVAKSSLINDCGWTDKSKPKEELNEEELELVVFDTSGLETVNTTSTNYDEQSFENEAIKEAKEKKEWQLNQQKE